MRKFDCVIWDWNGTLIDDLKIALEAVNDTMDVFDRPHMDVYRYYDLMRTDVRGFYEQLFDLSKVPYERLTAYFSMFYDQRVKKARLMEGAAEVLKTLNEAGVKQAIVSASHRDKVKRDTARFGINGFFADILGAADHLVGSKASMANGFILENKFDLDRVLVIGDLLHDAQMADKLGTRHVIIPNGHQTAEYLSENGVTILDDISYVPEFVLN